MTPRDIAQVLSEPIKINGRTVKNRLVMGPMSIAFPTKEGASSDQTIGLFERRAQGGIGMIIVGGLIGTTRAWEESPFRPLLRFDVDTHISEFRRVADAVHAHDVPIIAEVMVGFGRMGQPGPGRDVISASPMQLVLTSTSAMPLPGGEMAMAMPREATIAEIEEMEREAIEAAVHVQQAGWDGVEIPAIMSYFVTSFLSPRTNWRTDKYGGSTENRARLLVNVIRGIRKRVRPDFIVGLRMAITDYMPDGQSVEEYAAIAKLVEAEGLDYFAVSDGCYEGAHLIPDVDGRLIESGYAHILKESLTVPVLLQGLHDPAGGARAIAENHGDMIMLARPMLADPDYARKIVNQNPQAIVHCDRSNYCVRRMVLGMPVRCHVNPGLGRETRKKGALPPLNRILRVPLEKVMLGLTGSPLVMKLIGYLMNLRKSENHIR